MKIYLAGPVVTDKEIKAQMNKIEEALNAMPCIFDPLAQTDIWIDVFRPGKHKIPNEWGIDIDTWGQCVFTMDVAAIDECEWMVVADYGRQATAGTAWEVGYAFAKGIKILVIQMPGVEESSLMIRGCAANICKYEDFIAGTPYKDEETNTWFHTNDKRNDDRFERFFFERGRKQEKTVILN